MGSVFTNHSLESSYSYFLKMVVDYTDPGKARPNCLSNLELCSLKEKKKKKTRTLEKQDYEHSEE